MSTLGGNFVIDPVQVLSIRSDPIRSGPIRILPTASVTTYHFQTVESSSYTFISCRGLFLYFPTASLASRMTRHTSGRSKWSRELVEIQMPSIMFFRSANSLVISVVRLLLARCSFFGSVSQRNLIFYGCVILAKSENGFLNPKTDFALFWIFPPKKNAP